jgi:hypothetical protein
MVKIIVCKEWLKSKDMIENFSSYQLEILGVVL